MRDFFGLMNVKSVSSEHWLLLWELYINKWVKDGTLKKELLSEKIFQRLESKNVSFILDSGVNFMPT